MCKSLCFSCYSRDGTSLLLLGVSLYLSTLCVSCCVLFVIREASLITVLIMSLCVCMLTSWVLIVVAIMCY